MKYDALHHMTSQNLASLRSNDQLLLMVVLLFMFFLFSFIFSCTALVMLKVLYKVELSQITCTSLAFNSPSAL